MVVTVINGKKRCSCCNRILPLNNFYKRKDSKNGRKSKCIECESTYRKLNKDKLWKSEHARRLKNPCLTRAKVTLTGHRCSGHIINISIEEVETLFKTTTHCPICGDKLDVTFGNGSTSKSPSLDRINNEQELRTDNVWVICNECNTMKRTKTLTEYVNHCKRVVNKFGGR